MKRVKIKDLGKVVTGNTPSKRNEEFYNSNDISFFKPDSISMNGITPLEHAKEYLSEHARSKARIVERDSVLVTCIGNIGKIGIVVSEEASFNQQINAIVPNKAILSRYLAYNLLANQQKLSAIANAPVVPLVNKTNFENFEIEIHEDLVEQSKIVNILDGLATIVNSKSRQLMEYDQLIKSRFVEMFGDQSTNERKLPIVLFNDIIEYMVDIGSNGANSVISSNLNMSDEPDYAVMIRFTNSTKNDFVNNVKYISEEAYNFFKKSKVYGGELVFCKIGSAGKMYMMPNLNRPASLGLNQIMVKTNNKINIIYLYNLLSSDFGSHLIGRCVNGAVTKTITKGAIKKIPLMYPPLEMQNQFAEFVQQVDKLKFEVMMYLDI